MPFKATIFAFMMGSVMESKSAGQNKNMSSAEKPHEKDSPMVLQDSGLTHTKERRVCGGALSDQGLHLFLLLLLLPLLVKEVLQKKRLLLQKQRPLFVLVLDLGLSKGILGLALRGGPHMWRLGLSGKEEVKRLALGGLRRQTGEGRH